MEGVAETHEDARMMKRGNKNAKKKPLPGNKKNKWAA